MNRENHEGNGVDSRPLANILTDDLHGFQIPLFVQSYRDEHCRQVEGLVSKGNENPPAAVLTAIAPQSP
jgi:hypothetical protein